MEPLHKSHADRVASEAGAIAIRAPVLSYSGDPFQLGLGATLRYEPDAIVAMADGRITRFGPARKIRPQLPRDTPLETYGPDSLVMAGFVDCHVHFPQTPIIGAGGAQLLDWLNKYTFAAEQRFADRKHAREVARVFLAEACATGSRPRRSIARFTRNRSMRCSKQPIRSGCESSPGRC
jgi:guanine deaminase